MSQNFNVFYLSSHGMAGDHLFDWLPKALGSHPEIYIYMGESIRSKYLKERSRKDRPNPVDLTNFLSDMCGETYRLAGECFSYRAYQLEVLKSTCKHIRCANLVRHPYAWLEHYVNWRVNNLNMPKNNTFALDHEWSVVQHSKFQEKGLIDYTREDVEIWASLQGMDILNRMASDSKTAEIIKNIAIEDIAADKESFKNLVDYISHGGIEFDNYILNLAFKMLDKPFRSGSRLIKDPELLIHQWPLWKRSAFSKIVDMDTIRMFESYGYVL